MKKSVLVSTAISLVLLSALLLLGGCSQKKTETAPTDQPKGNPVSNKAPLEPSEWGNYFERVGGEELVFAQAFADKQPTQLQLTWLSEGGERTRAYIDTETIIGAFNALAVLDVAGESKTASYDNDSVWSFVMADGSTYSFSFNSGNAAIDNSYYNLENTTTFTQYERRLRSSNDEGYGNISAAQYASLTEGQTWWQDCYALLGEPLSLEPNDDYTALTVIYSSEDGQAAVLDFKSPDGEPNHYQLASKQIQAMPEELS